MASKWEGPQINVTLILETTTLYFKHQCFNNNGLNNKCSIYTKLKPQKCVLVNFCYNVLQIWQAGITQKKIASPSRAVPTPVLDC